MTRSMISPLKKAKRASPPPLKKIVSPNTPRQAFKDALIDKESKTKNNYKQLCVWPGTVLGETTPAEFESSMIKMFDGVRVKYHTEVRTKPNIKNGQPIPETGGRNDLFFYVHSDDISAFALSRLTAGIRWWEDVVGNGNSHLYTQDFINAHPLTW